jgi:hypothetical protein
LSCVGVYVRVGVRVRMCAHAHGGVSAAAVMLVPIGRVLDRTRSLSRPTPARAGGRAGGRGSSGGAGGGGDHSREGAARVERHRESPARNWWFWRAGRMHWRAHVRWRRARSTGRAPSLSDSLTGV